MSAVIDEDEQDSAHPRISAKSVADCRMIGAVCVLVGRSEPDGGTGARHGLGAADPGGAGPGSGEGDSSGGATGRRTHRLSDEIVL